MKPIGIMRALGLCRTFEKASLRQRAEIQQQRLRELVAYARQNSPYYRELYRGLPEELFSVYGLRDVSFTLSEELPRPNPGSGKFKHVMNAALHDELEKSVNTR